MLIYSLLFSEIPRQDREEWQCLRSRPGNEQMKNNFKSNFKSLGFNNFKA